ncbi:hypothetical protein BIU99_12730 [Plantibacter sp. MMLR14_011]|nr:hypothetical protein BIU99_12730 [Plantibacter sp. MMLR14_011]
MSEEVESVVGPGPDDPQSDPDPATSQFGDRLHPETEPLVRRQPTEASDDRNTLPVRRPDHGTARFDTVRGVDGLVDAVRAELTTGRECIGDRRGEHDCSVRRPTLGATQEVFKLREVPGVHRRVMDAEQAPTTAEAEHGRDHSLPELLHGDDDDVDAMPPEEPVEPERRPEQTRETEHRAALVAIRADREVRHTECHEPVGHLGVEGIGHDDIAAVLLKRLSQFLGEERARTGAAPLHHGDPHQATCGTR